MEDSIGDNGIRMKKKSKLISIIIVLVIAFCLVSYYYMFMIPVGCDFPDCILDPDQGIERSEWAFDITQIDDMNLEGYYGQGVVIGIIDTGIDPDHPDIDGNRIILWKDFVNGNETPYDDDGHGTAMAGIILANGTLKGIAPETHLIVAKAIAKGGTGLTSDVADAIEFCLDPNNDGDLSDGADIISLSLGGRERPMFGGDVTEAARKAISNGVFIVAAAGNDGVRDDGDVESPAKEELVIAVGAVNRFEKIAKFSSIGDNDGRRPVAWDDRVDPHKKPEVVVPGVGIVTTYLDGGYAEVSGTSPAAAFVSGILALLLEAHPEYMDTGSSDKILELKSAMMDTCKKLSDQDTPHDDHYGYGLLQAVVLNNEL